RRAHFHDQAIEVRVLSALPQVGVRELKVVMGLESFNPADRKPLRLLGSDLPGRLQEAANQLQLDRAAPVVPQLYAHVDGRATIRDRGCGRVDAGTAEIEHVDVDEAGG